MRTSISREEFEEFMEAQIKEIERYKWIESEKAGHDLGNDCCIEWIQKFAADFRSKWFGKKRKKT